ncbi:MAG: PorT family protein [Bacteroidales bacterium]|nr:PorT family protein [Bacteroidales bacterium]MBP5368410.1 PorT family protein [Bacteroidales bacterium]
MKLIAKLLAVSGIAVMLVSVCLPARAQVFGMKGGVTIGSITTKEVESVTPMLNYYFEGYYGYRMARYKYWTLGFGYFGTGATFSDTEMGNNIHYDAKVRFNNLVVPFKLKYSGEGRRKPRPYVFVGAMPAIMYNEDKTMTFYDTKVPNTDYIFDWTPRRVNLYVLAGGGCYYRHFTVDCAFSINVFRDYKEIEAPISYNKSFIITIGYQVSADRSKIW